MALKNPERSTQRSFRCNLFQLIGLRNLWKSFDLKRSMRNFAPVDSTLKFRWPAFSISRNALAAAQKTCFPADRRLTRLRTIQENRSVARGFCEVVGRHKSLDKLIGRVVFEDRLPLDQTFWLPQWAPFLRYSLQYALAAGIAIVPRLSLHPQVWQLNLRGLTSRRSWDFCAGMR